MKNYCLSILLVPMMMTACQEKRSSSHVLQNELPLPTCSQNNQLSNFETQIFICSSGETAAPALINLCLSKLIELHSEFDDSCKENQRPRLQRAGENLVEKAIGSVKTLSPSGLDATSLKEGMSILNRWYFNFAPVAYRDFILREKITKHYAGELTFRESMDKFFTQLWKKINKAESALMTGDALPSASFAITSSVLEAVLSSGDEVSSEIFMGLLVDVLAPLNQRVRVFTQIHDLACALKDCSGGNTAPIRELVELNAALGEPSKIQNILQNVQGLPPAIQAIYELLASNKSLIIGALDSGDQRVGLTGLGSDYVSRVQNLPLLDIPDHLQKYVAFVRSYGILQENLKRTGYFSGQDSYSLESGLSSASTASIKNRNQTLVVNAKQSLDSFASARSVLLANLRQRAESVLQDSRNAFSMKAVNAQITQITQDLQGLRFAFEKISNRHAEYVKQLETVEGTGALEFFDRRPLGVQGEVFNVGVAQANYQTNGSNTLNDVTFKTMNLKKNSYYRFSISGDWAPTCALKKSAYASVTDLSDVKIGPSGFVFAKGVGNVSVRSVDKAHRESTYTDVNATASVCAGTPGILPVSAKVCVSTSMGKRKEDTTSQSTTTSSRSTQDASFVAGIRLKDTPMPDFPAGSLIAVVTPLEGGSAQSIPSRVEVLSRDSIIFAASDSQISLIVNDCKPESLDSIGLTVSAELVEAKHQSAKSVLEAGLRAVNKVEEKAEDYIRSGVFGVKLLQNLKAQIIADLTANGTITPDFYQFPALRDLFNYWLDTELLQAELKIQIVQLERQLELAVFEAAKAEAATASAVVTNSLIEMEVQHAGLNADLYLLVDPIQRLVSYSRSRLVPMVKLHFPKILSELPGLQNLLGDIDAPLEDVLTTLHRLLNEVNERLSDEYSIRAVQDQTMYLMLRFPRPDLYGEVTSSLIPKADFSRSKSIWDALVLGNNAKTNLPLIENDLYRPDLAAGRLTCAQSKPVITDMMLTLAAKSSEYDEETQLTPWNQKQMSIQAEFAKDLMFPTVAGPLRYTLIDPDAGSFAMAVGFVGSAFLEKSQQLLQSKVYAESSGLGMSPFSNIEFNNFQGLRSVFNYAQGCTNCLKPDAFTDIVLSLRVEVTTHSTENSLSWITNCGGAI